MPNARPIGSVSRVVAAAAIPRQRRQPGVGDDDRRVDERGVDPQRELRIAGPVRRAGDRPVEPVQAADLRPCRGRRPVDDPEIAPQRAPEPRPRVGAEVAVVRHPCRDRRVGQLEEQRPRPGAEQEHRLAVERPRLRSGTIESQVSSARDPSMRFGDPWRRPSSEGSGMGRWGADFDPDRLADLETAMWKAYYRRQPARLFGHLLAGPARAGPASWPRAIAASLFLTKAAAQFARSTGDYDRFAPDIARGYRLLGLPRDRRRGRGRPAGAPLVGRPAGDRARGGCRRRRRDHPALCRDLRAARDGRRRGRTAAGRGGRGPRSRRDRRSGWSERSRARLLAEVARLLRASYRSLHVALAAA